MHENQLSNSINQLIGNKIMTNSNEVIKANAFSMDLPAHLQNQTTSRGSEDVCADDLVIPRLGLIQAMSPQRKKKSAEYIEGADEGMIFNTATGELYTDGVYIVPVYFKKEYLLWVTPRSSEGNDFRGAFATESLALQAQATFEETTEVFETHQQFCLVVNPETEKSEEVVLSMSRSQVKASKKLNTQIRITGGDRFTCVFHLSSVEDKSPLGEFCNWGVRKVGYCPEWAFKQAEVMYDAVKSGEKTIDQEVGAKKPTVNEKFEKQAQTKPTPKPKAKAKAEPEKAINKEPELAVSSWEDDPADAFPDELC